MKPLFYLCLSFFFAIICTDLYANKIKLSNGITIDTKIRKTLSFSKNHDKFEVDSRYLKYGLKGSKLTQFFVEIEGKNSNLDVSRVLGQPESIIDESLAIYTTTASKLSELQAKNLIRWTGYFKPHYKFAAPNYSDKTRPFDYLKKIKIDEKFSFSLSLSNAVSVSDVLKLKEQWIQEFNSWKSNSKPNINLIAQKDSRFMTLEIMIDQDVIEINGVYDQVFKFFAEKPEVVYIERNLPLGFKNHEASTILQSNYRTITGNQYDLVYRNGITGNGQVVCVADTGLDTGNCLFHDANKPTMVFDQYTNNHRKVLRYDTVTVGSDTTDTYDSAQGHGTHVAGSVAGSLASTDPQDSALYHGVAPNATLWFIDIQNEAKKAIYTPNDLSILFSPAYNGGVRIFTNSWGDSLQFTCNYDCQCTDNNGNVVQNSFCRQQYNNRDCCRTVNRYNRNAQSSDAFLYSNPDAIILFAGGNDGEVAASGTIGAPSTAKNVLAVGASVVSNQGYQNSVDHWDFTSAFTKYAAKGITDETTCCSYSGADADTVKAECCGATIKANIATKTTTINKNNVASFSSRGPCFDDADAQTVNRIKPDVVSPGHKIVSANSNGKNPHAYHCSNIRPSGQNNAILLDMMGTSMATPALAGGIALVREYYSTNLKRFSYKSISSKIPPSGVLLKALIIHAAQPMSGIVQLDGGSTQATLPQTFPNIYNGFGLPDLSFILPFANEQTDTNQPNFDIRMVNKKYFLSSQANPDTYSFRLNTKLENSGKFLQFFKATLTWYDTASTPSTVTTNTILNADLDLVVSIASKSKTYYGNGVATGDKVNTVETIDISGTEFTNLGLTSADEIVVTVKKGASGRFIPLSVPYALVVSSTYSFSADTSVFCYSRASTDSAAVCSGRGTCSSTNNCTCNANYSGDECENTFCGGISSTASNVCNGRGVCSDLNTCECNGGYSGNNCEIPICSQVLATNPSVCSGHGTCVAADTCQCQQGWAGKNCAQEASSAISFKQFQKNSLIIGMILFLLFESLFC